MVLIDENSDSKTLNENNGVGSIQFDINRVQSSKASLSSSPVSAPEDDRLIVKTAIDNYIDLCNSNISKIDAIHRKIIVEASAILRKLEKTYPELLTEENLGISLRP